MNVDVEKPSSSSTTLVTYDNVSLYENNNFELLDSEEPSSSSQSNYYQDRFEQLSRSWKGPQLVARRMKSKLFRTPSPTRPSYVTRTAAPEEEYMDETSRAVSSVKQNAAELEADDADQRYKKSLVRRIPLECQPSTSKEQPLPSAVGENRPLQRLTLQIGKKVMRFKVLDATPVVPAPIFQDASGKFRCVSCRIVFKTHNEFQKHNKNFHSSHKGFVCVICGTGFTNKSSLTMHHRIHNDTSFKSHQCNICHKVFSRAFNHMQHMKMHQTGRHHFCDMCGRCFKDLDTLVEHQTTCAAVMSGDYLAQLDKPLRYQCGYCEKLFHHKRDKFIHERIHTGEKPYECGYCGRSFTQSQTLTIHIRNHTGERPFHCQYCTKQFKDNSSLRKHEFRYHMSVDFMDFEETSKMGAGIVEDDYNETIFEEL